MENEAHAKMDIGGFLWFRIQIEYCCGFGILCAFAKQRWFLLALSRLHRVHKNTLQGILMHTKEKSMDMIENTGLRTVDHSKKIAGKTWKICDWVSEKISGNYLASDRP